MAMHENIESILVSEEQLKQIARELGEAVTRDYEGQELTVITILKGGVTFAADLCRHIALPVEMEFMEVSSYGNGTVSTGNIVIKKDTKSDVRGKNVLIAEDIVDSGNTLFYLKQLLLDRGAKSVKVCACLNKEARRVVPFEADYIGAEIPDVFAVGYGLDYAEKYRNLPYVGILKKEVYSNN